MGLIALAILIMTLVLALSRPVVGRFRFEHGTAATLGASLMLMTGLVPFDTALQTLQMLFYPLLTIVSLMIITQIAEHAGLLQRITNGVLQAGGGNGPWLFTLIYFTGAGVGLFFTNDAAILIFTPLVYALIEEIAEPDWTLNNKLPFYFAVLYVGNLAGALIISNPINIIVGSFFDIGFLEYALWMFFPALTSIGVSYVGLRIAFRGRIPARYKIPERLAHRRSSSPMITACSIVLLLTLIGFFAQGITGVPIAIVAAAGALILLSLHQANGNPAAHLVRNVGWDVLIFVIGIFIVAMGARNAGLTELMSGLIRTITQSLGESSLLPAVAMISGLCSSLINNHPTAGLMIWVVQDFELERIQTTLLVYAALIGGDLGPKMLPIGSLAALMWFRILRQRGVDVNYSLYIKLGVPVTLASILLAVAVLQLQMWLAGVSMSGFSN